MAVIRNGQEWKGAAMDVCRRGGVDVVRYHDAAA
jgi:hypothetical protein